MNSYVRRVKIKIMEYTESKPKADSWDVDGVLVRRFPFQAGALWPFYRERKYAPPQTLPEINREAFSFRYTLWEELTEPIHRFRPLNPDAVETLARLNAQGITNFINTGRPFAFDWINLTKRQLAPLMCFVKDLYFCPKELGIRTAFSKAEAIDRLRRDYQVAHVDDNPNDALPIAGFFPDVDIFLVWDYSTNLMVSKKTLERLPNVRVIKKITEII